MQEDTHKWVRTGSSDPASTSQRKAESIYVLYSKKNKNTCEEAAIVRPSHAGTHPTNVFWVSVDAGGTEGAAICQSSSNISIALPAYTANTAQSSPAAEQMEAAPSSLTDGFFPRTRPPQHLPTPTAPFQPRSSAHSPAFTSGERSLAPCLAGGAEPGCHGHVGLRAGRSEAKAQLLSSESRGGWRAAPGGRDAAAGRRGSEPAAQPHSPPGRRKKPSGGRGMSRITS